MAHAEHALRLLTISLAFLLMVAGTYAYIVLADVPVGAATIAIMQLTAIMNGTMIGVLGGYIYYTRS